MAFSASALRMGFYGRKFVQNAVKSPSFLFSLNHINGRPVLKNSSQVFYRSSSSTATKGHSDSQSAKEYKSISEDGDTRGILIYDGPLKGQMARVKFFSLSTSGLGLLMQPKIIMETMEGQTSVGACVAALGIIGIFTYVTPVLIHLLAKRYVTEMMYDPVKDSYTAVTYNFFLQKRQQTFKIDDVTVPEIGGIFTTILVKNSKGKKNPLFLSDTAFIEPEHYGRMMGYDKPLDFHLSSKPKPS